ncbi:MAG: 6-phosphogluconolactonase [Geminicoccaceae bacterium]
MSRATETVVRADAEALAEYAAAWLTERAKAAGGRASVCLSGGSTPKRLYELLAGPKYRDAFPWQRVHWFWGDERFVPKDDTLSNYRMVRLALLEATPVPAGNIHPIPTEGLAPEEAARAYERELKAFYGADRLDRDRPLFDVMLLGLGEDGHTASLFPGIAVLEERTRWVAAVVGVTPEARITLTYPALESSRDLAFLVAGPGKREILAQVRGGTTDLPAARVRPVGRLHWLLDRAAAA